VMCVSTATADRFGLPGERSVLRTTVCVTRL
jgi:hypothetical protein